MSEDHLQVRVAIESPRENQPQDRSGGVEQEARCADQPVLAQGGDLSRHRRVEKEWHRKRRRRLKGGVEGGIVERP